MLKKGQICSLVDESDIKSLNKKEKKKLNDLKAQNTKHFLILRRIDEKDVLVTNIYTNSRKNTKKVTCNNIDYYVSYINFYDIRECLLEKANIFLKDNYEFISILYDLHNEKIDKKRAKRRNR